MDIPVLALFKVDILFTCGYDIYNERCLFPLHVDALRRDAESRLAQFGEVKAAS